VDCHIEITLDEERTDVGVWLVLFEDNTRYMYPLGASYQP
jgi:hypothetical protein